MKPTLRSLLFSAFFCLMISSEQNNSFAQAVIRFGGTWTALNMTAPAGTPVYLVVDNPAAIGNAIIGASASAGWIIAENTTDWVNLKTSDINPETYVIPFGTASAYIPFTFNKTAGGAGWLSVSTYGTNIVTKDNTPYPISSPTPIAQGNGGNFIDDVIDRWWGINVTVATTADMTFSYPATENTLFGIDALALSGPNIKPQRWNGGNWDALVGPGAPSAVMGVGTVTSGSVSVFSPWVLVREIAPLPVTWLNVSAECVSGNMTIKWSTASEQNSAYFTVEKSLDGTNFTIVPDQIIAAGNSSTIKNYSSVDYETNSGTSFYRVKETDFNGAYMYSSMLRVSGCNTDNFSMNVYPSPANSLSNVNVQLTGEPNSSVLLVVRDVLGKEYFFKVFVLENGSYLFTFDKDAPVAAGIYFISATSNDLFLNKKIVIR